MSTKSRNSLLYKQTYHSDTIRKVFKCTNGDQALWCHSCILKNIINSSVLLKPITVFLVFLCAAASVLTFNLIAFTCLFPCDLFFRFGTECLIR